MNGDVLIGDAIDRRLKTLAQRRHHGDHLGAARDQRGDPFDRFAIILQPVGYAVDHLLLIWRELNAGLLDQRVERRGRFPDPAGLAARIGDDLARRQPQLADLLVDFLGEIVDALQALQLAERGVDFAERQHAGDAGQRDQRQQQQHAAIGQLSDRRRLAPGARRRGGRRHGCAAVSKQT